MRCWERLRDWAAAVIGFTAFLFQPFLLLWLELRLLWSRRFWPLGLLFAALYALGFLRLRRGPTKHGMRWRAFSELPLWRWAARHLGWSLEYVGKTRLDPSRQYIFALHPHGVFALERAAFWASRAERWDAAFGRGIDTRDLVATSLMLLPGAREWCRWTGCVLADRSVAASVLRHTHNSLLLYPGGEREQLLTERGKHIAFVRERRGFVRLALQHNAPILPCYLFGVNEQYKTSTFAMPFRRWLQRRWGVALPIFLGSLPLFWLPNRSRPVVAVVGAPIEPFPASTTDKDQQQQPTAEQIDELLQRYIAALKQLFDENKARLGYADAELQII